ncbi:MAG: hypothetical protein ACFFEA_13115, partial [Candidatus Thorarchaeota archaeon]
ATLEDVEDVIGFRKGKNETVQGEVMIESNRKPLAAFLMVAGILLILLNVWALFEDFLAWLIAIPVAAMAGILLLVLGLYVWYFFRKTFRIIVTSLRIVEEFFAKRFKQGFVRDYHYRFFESIEVNGNTEAEEARMIVHMSSGEDLVYDLPKDLIAAVVDYSRMFVGVQ